MFSKFFKIKLDLVGLGIIFYSLKSVEHIKEDERFLMTKYNDAEDVLKYIYNGTLVGFCTCSPGRYILNIHVDEPPLTYIVGPDFRLKLCIKVTDNRVFFNDLYALLRWEKDHSSVNSIEIENGMYKVTVDSFLPKSGKRGDDQDIDFYFEKIDVLPKLKYSEVPSFYS